MKKHNLSQSPPRVVHPRSAPSEVATPPKRDQSTLPFWEDSNFRQAAREFLNGLWADEQRRAMFKATMETIWRDYKTEARYEQLRQALSDAARRNE